MALFNESLEARFNGAIARMHGMKGPGAPAPQVSPEISHAIQLAQTNIADDLDALVGVRNLIISVAAPAIAAVAAGLRVTPPRGGLLVITGVEVSKVTAGFIGFGYDDVFAGGISFNGTFSPSIAQFRDSRLGKSQTATPGTKVETHLTGAFPTIPAQIRRAWVQANTELYIPIRPGLVMASGPSGSNINAVFGIFNETLNEQLIVQLDAYERTLSPAELQLPQ